MAKKRVYYFGDGKADGNKKMKNLLGGKGANLAEMANLRIPVPAGFTITTDVCTEFYENKGKYPKGLREEVARNLKKVEKAMGAKFGDKKNPLLVSVRSGARISMPGMMDTVLNLGLNDTTAQGLIEQTDDERFVYDCYRRFVDMYSDVVLGVDHEFFEEALQKKKDAFGVNMDNELPASAMKDLVTEFKQITESKTGRPFPERPITQLWGAIGAVFSSWNVPRAITYRKLNDIPEDWGTAVNVQSMVYGNMGEDCATGVAFTRNPSNGENVFYGEYLVNAQGEDVVAGIRTPQPVNNAGKTGADEVSLEELMPDVYDELEAIYLKLEKHYKEMQDIEFTIQNDKLWMLQARTGKRTAAAAVKIAVDMVKEKLISKKLAVSRLDPKQLDQLLHPMLDPKHSYDVLAKGLPASPGAATGQVVFSADDAVEHVENGDWKKVILVRIETSPEDIHGMNAAQAILTQRGGMTSHAAVVARGMGKCCVAGCGDIRIDYAQKTFTANGKVIKEGDWITLEGSKGEVIEGKIPTVDPELSGDFGTIMKWADSFRTMKVRTNADTPHDSEVARGFGAQGIGLCRTEHMFFEGDRIWSVREMILADNEEERRRALDKLLPMQRSDFAGIFEAMNGLPVTIRTLDPPLHEFLPHTEEEIAELSRRSGKSIDDIKRKNEELHEFNPMLGHRGCRLGIAYPEITEMQARAIIEAACQVKKKKVRVYPEIMIPLVGNVNELRLQKEIVDRVAKEVMKEYKVKVPYLVGTMIELPRAALTADQIAQEAEFFSFGTNDLTQTALGVSRDDAGSFLKKYVDDGILPSDPFQTLDAAGVGQLVEMGVKKGRKTRTGLKVGICGEHGGDPESVHFCHKVKLDYVSCSPYRVPIARLAAAQAAIGKK